MINKKVMFSGLMVLIWLIIGNWAIYNKSTSEAILSRSTHPNLFFDEKTFYEGVVQANKNTRLLNYQIKGGIIPHHLYPGFILSDFFNQLARQKPKTIILIGPNHYERGRKKWLTSVYGWETPFGVVEPNETIISDFVVKEILRVDESVLPHDHAVAGMMPYIKYYLPKTRVVPILISGFTTEKETEILADNLKHYMDKETVLVAAVDFSHYLRNKEAQEKDEITMAVLKKFDYRQLFSFNNNYMDSPASIATLLMVMQKLETTQMDILFHTNSGELQKDDSIETTSYFSIAYY